MELSTVQTAVIRDIKLNLKASCPICSEEFDNAARSPKMLACGHSMCFTCLDRMLNAIQVSYVGNGHCSTGFECPTCRAQMHIPDKKAAGFPTNHQLLDVIVPQDSRLIRCLSCKMNGSEVTFHICRECTIKEHEFDVNKILENEEPPIHPDNYAYCSTCILKEHLIPGHTVIDYFPIRIDYECKKNMRSVDALRATLREKFSSVRTILQTIPEIIRRKESEISKIVDFMERSKSRHALEKIFEKYKQEMEAVILSLSELEKSGGKMTEVSELMLQKLESENEKINDTFCFVEKKDLKELLKIPEETEEEEPSEDAESDEDKEAPNMYFDAANEFIYFCWQKVVGQFSAAYKKVFP